MTIVGQILILIGALFSLFGALGILRMPDMYNRLQAGTKATTLGAMSLVIGVGLMDPAFLAKSILLVLFILLTNPISSSMMARMGRRAGVSLGDARAVDEYEQFLRRKASKGSVNNSGTLKESDDTSKEPPSEEAAQEGGSTV